MFHTVAFVYIFFAFPAPQVKATTLFSYDESTDYTFHNTSSNFRSIQGLDHRSIIFTLATPIPLFGENKTFLKVRIYLLQKNGVSQYSNQPVHFPKRLKFSVNCETFSLGDII